MLRMLPLSEIYRAAGATFASFCGWEVPSTFSSVDREYAAMEDTAGLADWSCSGILELRGDDRTRFLHGIVTNDIKALQPGQGCYAALLTPQGRMVADLRVFCLSDALLLTTEPSLRDKLAPALRKYIIGDRPQLADRSNELGVLSLQGPRWSQIVNNVFVVTSPTQLYQHIEVSWADASIRICRVGRTRAGGCDLIVPISSLQQIWQALLERGRPQGLEPVGLESCNVHRIEAGIPWFGYDMDENTLPLEAGLEKSAISFNKGCYIGQESVARITYRGHVNRKLAGLLLAGGHAAPTGARILYGDQEAGWITSSVWSPGLQKAIALGYLRREISEPGTPLRIEDDQESTQAEVVSLPFAKASTAA